jgi:hypothetical protein
MSLRVGEQVGNSIVSNNVDFACRVVVAGISFVGKADPAQCAVRRHSHVLVALAEPDGVVSDAEYYKAVTLETL